MTSNQTPGNNLISLPDLSASKHIEPTAVNPETGPNDTPPADTEPRPASVGPEQVLDALRTRGITEAQLSRAEVKKGLLKTRLLSTLVNDTLLEEELALQLLAEQWGAPAVSLRQSAIDLALPGLDRALTLERFLLPVQRNNHGIVLVACADLPPPDELSQLAVILGGPIHPCIALHLDLRRAWMAARQLRRDQPGATTLLGDSVDSDRPDRETVYCHKLPAAADRDAPGCLLEPQRRAPHAVVALRDDRIAGHIAQLLTEAEITVCLASDGAQLLRETADHPPQFLVLDADLQGRPGLEIIQLLGRSQRYADCNVVLLSAEQTDLSAWRFAETTVSATPETIEQVVTDAVESRGADGVLEDEGGKTDCCISLHKGHAALLQGALAPARQALENAVAYDPLSGLAQRDLGQLAFFEQDMASAERCFHLADQLISLDHAHLAQWAEATQRLGALREATVLWERTAQAWPVPRDAEQIQQYTTALKQSVLGAKREY